MIRIDKFLAMHGYGSRAQVKKLILDQLVFVDGEVIKDPKIKVDETKAEVEVNGKQVTYEPYQYFLLNKPKGYISATSGNALTVLDLIEEPYPDLFPCGRLDKDTTGLLLITNNGPLAHRLLSPKHHVEKEYEVIVDLPLKEDLIQEFKKGIRLNAEELCQPADLIILSDYMCHLIIREGKFHQIKRMFQKVGYEVIELKRVRMKNLVLEDSLLPGTYRKLTKEEITELNQFE